MSMIDVGCGPNERTDRRTNPLFLVVEGSFLVEVRDGGGGGGRAELRRVLWFLLHAHTFPPCEGRRSCSFVAPCFDSSWEFDGRCELKLIFVGFK